MVPALLTYGVLLAWLVVPGAIASLALRSSRVQAWFQWAGFGVSRHELHVGNTTVKGWRE